jgi:hypothetical protein
MAGTYRTFVTLDPYERWILRVVQAGVVMAGNKKPPINKVIGGILREYWETFEKDADPEQLRQLVQKVPPPLQIDDRL